MDISCSIEEWNDSHELTHRAFKDSALCLAPSMRQRLWPQYDHMKATKRTARLEKFERYMVEE